MTTESHDLDSSMGGLQICSFIPNNKIQIFATAVSKEIWQFVTGLCGV